MHQRQKLAQIHQWILMDTGDIAETYNLKCMDGQTEAWTQVWKTYSTQAKKSAVVMLLHCIQKKTPTHFYFYISLENAWIYTKFSGYVYQELSIL